MSDCRTPASTFSDAALQAFRRMMYHKVAMWDAAFNLEAAINGEVDTGQLDSLAAGFGSTADVLYMPRKDLLNVMTEWMSDPDHATFYEEEGE